MKWRYAVFLLALLFLTAVRAAVGVPQTTTPSLTLAGQVDIATGTDGKLLVLVDEETPEQPGDGLVEHAFRLQGARNLAFSGPATVTYTRGRLTIELGPQAGWVFTVANRLLPSPDPALTAQTVGGIAHSWGEAVHQPPATLFSTISAGSCSKTSASLLGSVSSLDLDGDPGCKNCRFGGLGMPACSVECDGGSNCEADCGADAFACCSCGSFCGCCSNTETGRPH